MFLLLSDKLPKLENVNSLTKFTISLISFRIKFKVTSSHLYGWYERALLQFEVNYPFKTGKGKVTCSFSRRGDNYR